MNNVVSLENFTDKYIPLMAQNIACDTLRQVVGRKECKKLELYEEKIFQNLHETLVKDKGVPDLESHRDVLLKQINNKLTIIKQIIDERKFLVPKEKAKKYNIAEEFLGSSKKAVRSDSVKSAHRMDSKSPMLSNLGSFSGNEEEFLQLTRQREAEQKIK